LRSNRDCRAGGPGHNNTARGSATQALIAPLGGKFNRPRYGWRAAHASQTKKTAQKMTIQ
jgi:hypothetical protein